MDGATREELAALGRLINSIAATNTDPSLQWAVPLFQNWVTTQVQLISADAIGYFQEFGQMPNLKEWVQEQTPFINWSGTDQPRDGFPGYAKANALESDTVDEVTTANFYNVSESGVLHNAENPSIDRYGHLVWSTHNPDGSYVDYVGTNRADHIYIGQPTFSTWSGVATQHKPKTVWRRRIASRRRMRRGALRIPLPVTVWSWTKF